MKKLIYLLIFLPLLLQFCTQEMEPQLIKRKSPILVGDTAGMTITVFETPDTLSGRYNVDQQQSFDLDQDGQPDLKLVCFMSGSPGWGVNQGSYIEPLSDSVAILGFDNTDFIYYYYDIDTNRWGISTEIFYNTYLESDNTHHSDSVYSQKQRTYPKVLNTSDSIASASQWIHQKLTFRSTGNGGAYRQRTDDLGKHIAYYTQEIKNIHYGTWPYQSDHYVGIKYKNRMGWIKINLLHDARMVVYEVALQK